MHSCWLRDPSHPCTRSKVTRCPSCSCRARGSLSATGPPTNKKTNLRGAWLRSIAAATCAIAFSTVKPPSQPWDAPHMISTVKCTWRPCQNRRQAAASAALLLFSPLLIINRLKHSSSLRWKLVEALCLCVDERSLDEREDKRVCFLSRISFSASTASASSFCLDWIRRWIAMSSACFEI